MNESRSKTPLWRRSNSRAARSASSRRPRPRTPVCSNESNSPATTAPPFLEEENIKTWTFRDGRPEDAEIVARLSAKTATGGGAADPKAIGHHGHAAQLADTVEAIRTGRPPRIDGREGRRAVEIILAIYLAAETGRTVTLPLASDPDLAVRRTGV